MAKGFKHGGGANPLNFTVKAYPSEVELNNATAAENTIGVVTTNPITGWYFAYAQPENMVEGEVWITTGVSSSVEFNALKTNNVMVYPLVAKQMVSGTLKDVTAKSYQNGEWVGWAMFLYKDGDEYTVITGGWVCEGKKEENGSVSYTQACEIVRNETNLYVVNNHISPNSCIVRTKLPVNLSGYSTLRVDGEFKTTSINSKCYALAVWEAIGTYSWDYIAAQTQIPTQSTVNSIEVDIRSLSGEYYIGFVFSTAAGSEGSIIRMDSCQMR